MAKKKYVETNTALRDLGIGGAAGGVQAAVTLPFDKYEQLVTRHMADNPKAKIPVRSMLAKSFRNTFGKDFKNEYLKKYPARAMKSALGMGTAWMVAKQVTKAIDGKN